jgi:hypothetical protein
MLTRQPKNFWRDFKLLVLLAGVLDAGFVYGDDIQPRVACLPERPVASVGDHIRIETYVTAANSEPLAQTAQVAWSTTGGQIIDQGVSVRWRLSGVEPDREYRATAKARVGNAVLPDCSIRVWVSTASANYDDQRFRKRRGEYISRRAFLGKEPFGEPGFGLYSYFLIAARPDTPQAQERFASFVRAFLDVMVSLTELENFVERSKLNMSYLPTKADLPDKLKTADLSEIAKWVTKNYDFDRAKSFLSLYPTLSGSGPYIVAVQKPLERPMKPMLPGDFSEMDAATIHEAVKRYMNTAAQLYDWDHDAALLRLRDKVMTAIAGMFVGREMAQRWMQHMQ